MFMCRLFVVMFVLIGISWQPAQSRPDSQPDVQTRNEQRVFSDYTCQRFNSAHFSLFCSSDAVEAETIGNLLDFCYDRFFSIYRDFGFDLNEPNESLEWILFDHHRSFTGYALGIEKQDLSWLTSYYSAKTNRVAIVTPGRLWPWDIRSETGNSADIAPCPPDAETDLAKIIHEAAHQLSFNTGLQKRRVMYPIWASEGLAMYFEHALLGNDLGSVRYPAIRGRRLQKLHRQGELVDLKEFVAMTRFDGSICEVDLYAQAWGVFEFLSHHQPQALKTYYSILYALKPGARSEYTLRREFVEAFGPLDQLDRHWKQFLDVSASAQ